MSAPVIFLQAQPTTVTDASRIRPVYHPAIIDSQGHVHVWPTTFSDQAVALQMASATLNDLVRHVQGYTELWATTDLMDL